MKRLSIVIASILLLMPLSAESLERSYDRDELYSEMIVNNTSLRSAEQDIYESQLDIKDAQAKYYPSVDLTLTGTYMFNPIVGPIVMSTDDLISQLGLSAPGLNRGGYITLYDGMENTMYNASLTLTQPLITWGKIPQSVNLFKTVSSIQSIKKSDLERQLSAELDIRLYLLDVLGEINLLLSEATSIASELVDIAEASYSNGVILKEEYLDAKIAAMELDIRKIELAKEYEANLQELRKLTGIDNLKAEEIEFEADDSILYRYEDSEYEELLELSTASSSLPLQMINKMESAHEIQEDITNRSMYGIPDFALQVTAGYGGPRFPFIEAGWRQKDSWSVNVTLAMQTNLWDGGVKINDKNRAQSSQVRDDIAYDEAVSTIESTLNENYNSMLLSLSKIEYLTLKGESLQQILENRELSAEFGNSGKMEVLAAKLEIIENETALLQEKASLSSNVFMISYLISEDI